MLLLISFENNGAQCSNVLLFFYPVRSNPTILFLLIAVLGIITGAFYHAFVSKVLESTPEEDEADFE